MVEDKKKFYGVSSTLKEAGEELQLATQADLEPEEEDLAQFEQLLHQLIQLEGLTDRAEVLQTARNAIGNASDDPTLLRENIMEASLRVEESAQLHNLRRLALMTGQLSLALSSTSISDEDLEDAQRDVFEASRELIIIKQRNLQKEAHIAEVDNDLQDIQNKINKVEKKNTELRNSSTSQIGSLKEKTEASEQISKLEGQIAKISGRYDFTRFLTQLLLMAGKADCASNKEWRDLFKLCGEAATE